jgi:hypothetical protein
MYACFLSAWFATIILFPTITHKVPPWYTGCTTKFYGQGEGQNQEHGNDLSCFGLGTPITALLGGTVSFAGFTSFGYYEVTWRLDHPKYARGSPYAYVEDMWRITVSRGQHIRQGQVIGYSLTFVEFGLTPDYAYGVSNWRWGINSIFLIYEARNGTLPKEVGGPPPTPVPTQDDCETIIGGHISVASARACAFDAGFRGQQSECERNRRGG